MTEFEDVMGKILIEEEEEKKKFSTKAFETIERWSEKVMAWITDQAAKLRSLLVRDPFKKGIIMASAELLNDARSELNKLKKDLKHAKANGESTDDLKEKMNDVKEQISNYRKSIVKGHLVF